MGYVGNNFRVEVGASEPAGPAATADQYQHEPDVRAADEQSEQPEAGACEAQLGQLRGGLHLQPPQHGEHHQPEPV